MIRKNMPKSSVTLYRIIDTLLYIIFIFMITFFVKMNVIYRYGINLSLLLIYLIIIIWYEKKRYLNTFYYLQDSYIIINKGVIFQSEIILFLDGVQGFQYSQGILQRIFKLYTARFYTSGKNAILINISREDLLKIERDLSDKIEI